MNRAKQLLQVALWALVSVASVASAVQNCPAGYPRTTPNADFADAGNGTVLHLPSGLVWKRCTEGLTWNSGGSTCDGSAVLYTWQQAFQRVDAVNASADAAVNAGQTDWRLPN